MGLNSSTFPYAQKKQKGCKQKYKKEKLQDWYVHNTLTQCR